MKSSGKNDDVRKLLTKAIELYEDGNYSLAYPLYKELAESGNLEAITVLAWMYQTGNGTPQSKERAEHWYLIASDNGENSASFYLGKLYIENEKFDEAYRVLIKAANDGYIPAIYKIGQLEYGGIGTKMDRNRAYHWFRKAAVRGHIFAYKAQSVMLMQGHQGTLNRLKGLIMYLRILIKGPLIGARDPESDLVRD